MHHSQPSLFLFSNIVWTTVVCTPDLPCEFIPTAMMVVSKMQDGGGEIAHSCSATLRGDGMLTTVECLRGRLLAERMASRVAREESHLMAKRLTEMERLLDIEIKAWNRAEKRLRYALKKLQTLKILDDFSGETLSDSSSSLVSSTSTGLQLSGNRNSSNKSGTYYSAHSVESGANSINNGNHRCDEDDDDEDDVESKKILLHSAADCTRRGSEQDQSILEDLVPASIWSNSGNNGSRHVDSYKFQLRNIEEEKGKNSDNNQKPKKDLLVSIKQVKDQPHDSMARRVVV